MDVVSDDRTALATLGWLFEPTNPELHRLVAAHGPVETLHRLSAGAMPFPGRAEIRHLTGFHLWRAAAAAVDEAGRGGIRVVIPADPGWPTGLRDGDGAAPVCLWARGPATVPAPHRSVTVVGSRASTSYGNYVAADLAGQLAADGWPVVSTGGFGVDGAALRAAVAAGGQAVALVAHGLDQIHPVAHAGLFERVAADGLILSAWPPGARPTRERTQAGQRLLAALTAGTVVVEASLRSSAVHVVRQAVDRGRVGMVVPGPVTSATSAGCHELLRTNARIRPVTCADDVVADVAGELAGGRQRR
jgi:DNA processing protein